MYVYVVIYVPLENSLGVCSMRLVCVDVCMCVSQSQAIRQNCWE